MMSFFTLEKTYTLQKPLLLLGTDSEMGKLRKIERRLLKLNSGKTILHVTAKIPNKLSTIMRTKKAH